MGKSLIRECRVNRKDTLQYLQMEGGAFLVGILLMIFLQMTAKPEDVYPLGSYLSLFFTVICLLFGNYAMFGMYFNLAVTMGAVRKSYIKSTILVYTLRNFILFLIIRIFLPLEANLYLWMFPGKVYDEVEPVLLSLPWMIAWSCLLTGLIIGACALGRKFGKKGRVAVMVIWIALCWSVPGVLGSSTGDNVFQRMGSSVKDMVTQLQNPLQIMLVLGFGLLLCGLGYLGMKKEAVSI